MGIILIIFGILKVILLVFLAILALVLFLLALVVFVPFGYEVQGGINGQKTGKARVWWFLGFVSLIYCYNSDKSDIIIKILGIPIKRTKEEEEAEEKNENSVMNESELYVDKKYASKDKKSSDDKRIDKTKKEKASAKNSETTPEELAEDVSEKVVEERHTIFETIRTIKDKVEKVIKYSDGKLIFKLTWDLLKKCYYALKPNVFKVYGELGFDQPATTGITLGGIGIFSAFSGMNIRITPNYDKAVIKMSIYTKGNFILWLVIWPIIVFILKKPIWKLVKIKLFRKGEKA